MSHHNTTHNNKTRITKLSIILSSIVLSLFGWVWYGVLFNDIQVDAHRYTVEDYENSNPIWYLGGLVISVFISWGIGFIIRLEKSFSLIEGMKSSIKAVLGFGLPLISYPLVFSPLHDWALYAIGLSQIAIGWIMVGAILGAMAKSE